MMTQLILLYVATLFNDGSVLPDTPMPKGMGFLDKLTSPILSSIKNLINYNI